jgi:hypothetical protein
MSRRQSEDKSTCIERASACVVQAQGIAAPKISGRYNLGTSFIGSDTTIEVKRRATGFPQLYDRLNDRVVLIGKADRQEPLVALHLSLAAEIAKSAP